MTIKPHSTTRLNIVFGAFASTLDYQLAAVGLNITKTELAHYQRDADALSRLLIRGLLTEGEGRIARQKLANKIVHSIYVNAGKKQAPAPVKKR